MKNIKVKRSTLLWVCATCLVWIWAIFYECAEHELINSHSLKDEARQAVINLDRQEAALLTKYCATHNDCVRRGDLHTRMAH